MQFQLSVTPEKYDLSLYEGVKLSITAKNDGNDPMYVKKLENIIPEGFETLKIQSLRSNDAKIKSNQADVDHLLQPGKRYTLASFIVIALRSGRFTWTPKVVLENGTQRIGTRTFFISPSVQKKEQDSIVSLQMEGEIVLTPGERSSLHFSIQSSFPRELEYLILLNAIPERMIGEVERNENVFPLKGKHLLFLESIPSQTSKSFHVNFKSKAFHQLQPFSGETIEERVSPLVIAKTEEGIIKSDLSVNYSFRVDARPNLAPLSVKFEDLSLKKSFLNEKGKRRSEIFLKTAEKCKVIITLKKESGIPINGVRVTDFLPESFKILSIEGNHELSSDASLIRLPELSQRQKTIILEVQAPENSLKALLYPSINCNECTGKKRANVPLFVRVLSAKEIQSAEITPLSWIFSPQPPFLPDSKVIAKIQMKNQGELPLSNFQLKFDLPHLQFKKVLKSSPLLKSRKDILYKHQIRPKQTIKAEVLFHCQGTKTGKWRGTYTASWEKAGKPFKICEHKDYEIKKEGFFDKLQFWRS
ncbi:MAG: hypothetical protein GWO20_16785 [Candidatus Korarchaeota archaeon]|nr:hypothetical protein [Candidatus Korarchaeota archaeon]NIU85120.1 hypothetical protein [Candidatus Thorarchaeota archaeon]NIW15084.1 hypothetical protein [Candidatus Thorarchaeota archaeon]NIW53094.1 hypothetical protein [Candidatus Korarchaeota archaeon]